MASPCGRQSPQRSQLTICSGAAPAACLGVSLRRKLLANHHTAKTTRISSRTLFKLFVHPSTRRSVSYPRRIRPCSGQGLAPTGHRRLRRSGTGMALVIRNVPQRFGTRHYCGRHGSIPIRLPTARRNTAPAQQFARPRRPGACRADSRTCRLSDIHLLCILADSERPAAQAASALTLPCWKAPAGREMKPSLTCAPAAVAQRALLSARAQASAKGVCTQARILVRAASESVLDPSRASALRAVRSAVCRKPLLHGAAIS